MKETADLPTGYYRVRKDKHWCVARWMPTCGSTKRDGKPVEEAAWRFSNDIIMDPGYWDEVGEKVA